MKAKKSVKVFLSLVLSTIILFLGALYIYDPLQVFHKPWGRDITFHKNMRQQAAGIINNYSFDSIILGTSMLENTSANKASEIFGGQFVNISMPGSDFVERKLILDYLFKKKTIKKVIYSLDSDKFIYQIKGYKLYPLKNYAYLYDQNPFNDINAYLNNKFLKCLKKFSVSQKCTGDRIGLDRPGAWYKSKHHSIRYGGLDKWFAANNNYQIKNAFKQISSTTSKIAQEKTVSLKNINIKIEKAKHYINKNLISLAKKYPDTEFLIVSPPYSRIYYAIWAQYNLPAYEIHKAIIEYLVQESMQYKNLKIFGYEDNALVDDIAKYKDPKHYHYSVNAWITQEMSQNRGLLTVDNIDMYLQSNTKKAQDYNLIKLGNEINSYLSTDRK